MPAQQDYSQYLDPRFTQNRAWGDPNQQGQVSSAIQQFQQSFKNLTGRDPTPQEVQGFSSNALYGSWNAPGDLNYSDTSNLVNNYIQNANGPDVANFQKTQQASQLGDTQKMIQDLISKQTASTASDLSNPNSPTYQAFAGNMNNLGITPSSGAFQAGLGGQLGETASNAINAALGSVSLPALSGIQGSASVPFNFAQANSDLGHLNQLQDFGLQSDLARQLNSGGGMDPFQMALGSANTAANIGQGAASVKKSGLTWICTAMWKSNVLAASEVDRLHHHLFTMFFKKFWKFLGYFTLGKIVVFQANRSNVDWHEWRSLFYDRVIAEPDPAKALELYEDAFWRLFKWAFSITSTLPETIS